MQGELTRDQGETLQVCALCWPGLSRSLLYVPHEPRGRQQRGGEDHRCGGVTQNSNTNIPCIALGSYLRSPLVCCLHHRLAPSKFPAPQMAVKKRMGSVQLVFKITQQITTRISGLVLLLHQDGPVCVLLCSAACEDREESKVQSTFPRGVSVPAWCVRVCHGAW